MITVQCDGQHIYVLVADSCAEQTGGKGVHVSCDVNQEQSVREVCTSGANPDCDNDNMYTMTRCCNGLYS